MKRIGMWMLVAILALSAVACTQKKQSGVEETAVFVDPNAVKAGAYGDLYFAVNGYRFGIYDPMEDVLEHIQSSDKFTGESCAVDGEDYVYFFSGFEIMANEIDGAERVTAITILDDTVKTPDGLYIGMTEDEAKAIIGSEPDGSGIYVTVDGTAQRNVTVQDGTVRTITYVQAA